MSWRHNYILRSGAAACVVGAAIFWLINWGEDTLRNPRIEIVHVTPPLSGPLGFVVFLLGSFLVGATITLLSSMLLPRLLGILHWNRLVQWVVVGGIVAELLAWVLLPVSALIGTILEALGLWPLASSIFINTVIWIFVGIPYGAIAAVPLHRVHGRREDFSSSAAR